MSGMLQISVATWCRANSVEPSELLRLLAEQDTIRAAYLCESDSVGVTSNPAPKAQSAAFHEIVLPALLRAFEPPQSVCVHILKTKQLSLMDGQPCTIDDGPECPPRILLRWRGTADDLMCLAHEAGHALQVVWSDHAITPPLLRETCAFLSEIAVLRWALCHCSELHRALVDVWERENARYFGSDMEVLRADLLQPERAHTYRHNYPLARLAALRLASDWDTARLCSVFADSVGGTECLRSALGLEAPQRLPCPERIWSETEDFLGRLLSAPAYSLNADIDAMIVDLTPGVAPRVVSRGPSAPLVRFGSAGTPEASIVCAGVMAEASALPRAQGAAEAPLSAALGRALTRGPHFEAAPTIAKCLGSLAPAALAEVLCGAVSPDWVDRTARIGVITVDGQLSNPYDTLASEWLYWRSIGALALGAIRRGDARGDLRPDAFLNAIHDEAKKPALVANVPLAKADALTALGLMIAQLARAPYHQQFSLRTYLPIDILPPLQCGQAQVFIDSNTDPVGAVTWAWISDMAESRLHQTGHALAEGDWSGGDRLFFNDWLAAPDAIRPIVRYMTQDVFPSETATSLRRNLDGSVRRINRWTGSAVRAGVNKPIVPNPKTSCVPTHRTLQKCGVE